jgi:hypothetical protein
MVQSHGMEGGRCRRRAVRGQEGSGAIQHTPDSRPTHQQESSEWLRRAAVAITLRTRRTSYVNHSRAFVIIVEVVLHRSGYGHSIPFFYEMI